MTDDLDETNGANGEPLDPRIREELRKSREHAARADEAEARAIAAERRSVFAEVGIPSAGMGSLFRDAYQGDLSPEAVKAAAEGYGILGGAQSDGQQDGLTEAEREAQRRIAGAGSGLPPQPGSDPREVIMQKIREIPFHVGDDPAQKQEEIMALVRQLENEHPEVGRFTSPN